MQSEAAWNSALCHQMQCTIQHCHDMLLQDRTMHYCCKVGGMHQQSSIITWDRLHGTVHCVNTEWGVHWIVSECTVPLHLTKLASVSQDTRGHSFKVNEGKFKGDERGMFLLLRRCWVPGAATGWWLKQVQYWDLKTFVWAHGYGSCIERWAIHRSQRQADQGSARDNCLPLFQG